jgi:peptidoglycan/LPS O-acetylase OafA/YrhL
VRFLNRSQLIRLLVAVICCEPLVRAAATPFTSSPWPIYLLTPFRVDGLAAVSLLTIVLEQKQTAAVLTRWSGLLFAASAGLLLALLASGSFDWTLNSIWFNAAGYSLTALVGVSLIAYVALHGSSALSRFLERPPLVLIGRISYGLYLFHLLALVVVSRWSEALGIHHLRMLTPVTFAPAAAFSWASYVFYEQRMIRWGHALTERSKSPAVAAG